MFFFSLLNNRNYMTCGHVRKLATHLIINISIRFGSVCVCHGLVLQSSHCGRSLLLHFNCILSFLRACVCLSVFWYLFLNMPWIGLSSVFVTFPGHTHSLFLNFLWFYFFNPIMPNGISKTYQ